MPEAARKKKVPPNPRVNRLSSRFPSYTELKGIDQLYGIEIEAENYRELLLGTHNARWSTVNDGSLRGGGVEFVSIPLPRVQLEEDLASMYAGFASSALTFGPRTSTHIHLDMRGFQLRKIANFCYFYCLVEPVLFELCGKDRENGIYCTPWFRAEDQIVAVKEACGAVDRTKKTGSFSPISSKTCKYAALYLEPLYRFGTVEFRGCPVFSDMHQLLEVVDILTNIKQVAKRFPTVSECNQYDTHEAIREILPTHLQDRGITLCEEMETDAIAENLVYTRLTKVDWSMPDKTARKKLIVKLKEDGDNTPCAV